MKAGWARALTILARICGIIWTLVGALFILMTLSGPPTNAGTAIPIASGVFVFSAGLCLLFVKPVTAEAVDAFFRRRR